MNRVIGNGHDIADIKKTATKIAATGATVSESAILDSIRAIMLISVYRVRGHLLANLDPLGLTPRPAFAELDPKSYGFTEADMDRPIYVDGMLGFQHGDAARDCRYLLQRAYCGSVGVEFMHLQNPEQKSWVQERIEAELNKPHYDKDSKRHILQRLTAGEAFEKFLATKFVGA